MDHEPLALVPVSRYVDPEIVGGRRTSEERNKRVD
jgi:hypothetical protein